MKELPIGKHLTYQLQYRRCGHPGCKCAREGKRHGPYWYAFWRDDQGRMQSVYLGKGDAQIESVRRQSE